MHYFPIPKCSSEEELALFSYLPPELWVEILTFCPMSSLFTLAASFSPFSSLLSCPDVCEKYLDNACLFIQSYDGSYEYLWGDIRVGPYMKKYENSTESGFYVDGKKFGSWAVYDNDGSFISRSFYREDSFIKWDSNNNVKMKGVYLDDSHVSQTVFRYIGFVLTKKLTYIKAPCSRYISGPFCVYDRGIVVEEGTLECENINEKEAYFVGERKLFHKNGSLRHVCWYESGIMTGSFEFYNEKDSLYIKGSVSKTNNVSVLYGDLEVHAPDGTYSVIPYLDGEKHGIAYVYDKDHTCRFRGEFQHGKKVGTWTGLLDYYPYLMVHVAIPEPRSQGIVEFIDLKVPLDIGIPLNLCPPSMKIEIDFDDDKIHGNFLLFYSTGETFIVGNFKSGNKHGPWYSYTPNGVVTSQGFFYEDTKVDDWIHRTDEGNMNTKERYLEGVFITKTYSPESGKLISKEIYSYGDDEYKLLFSEKYHQDGHQDRKIFFVGKNILSQE